MIDNTLLDNNLFNPLAGPTTPMSGPKKIVPFTLPVYNIDKNPVFAPKPTIDSAYYQIVSDSVPGAIAAASSVQETAAPPPNAAPLMQLLMNKKNKNNLFIPNIQENFSTTSIKEGMSFENGNGKMDTKTSITYNFSNATVYKKDLDFSSTKYLQVNNYTPKPSPNFTITYSTGITKNCNSTTAYFYNVLHEIIGVTVIDESMTPISDVAGELVIDISDGNTKRYICFILSKSEKDDINDIDNFFVLKSESSDNSCSSNSSSTGKLSLSTVINNSIPPQEWSIFYKDNNKTEIFVMTNPIPVNNASSAFLSTLSKTTSLFNTSFSNEGWTQIMKNSLYGDDEIYIDCQPTGESNEQVSMRNVALQNDTTVGGESKSTYAISILSILTMVLIITSVVVGKVFKFLFVDWIVESSYDSEQKALIYIRSLAVFFFILYFISFICMTVPVQDSNAQYVGIVISMYTSILIVFVTLHTYFNKNFLKKIDSKTKLEKELSLTKIIEFSKDFRWINIIAMIKQLMGSWWTIFVKNEHQEDKPKWGPVIIMGIYFLLIIIVYPIQVSKSQITSGQAALWSFVGFLILSLFLKGGNILFGI